MGHRPLYMARSACADYTHQPPFPPPNHTNTPQSLNAGCPIQLPAGRRVSLMVSALDFWSSGPGSGPGRGHCVVFLGKTIYSHGASLPPRVYMGTGEFKAGGNPAMD